MTLKRDQKATSLLRIWTIPAIFDSSRGVSARTAAVSLLHAWGVKVGVLSKDKARKSARNPLPLAAPKRAKCSRTIYCSNIW